MPSAPCFLVDDLYDSWAEGGGNRVGAMAWRTHELLPYDSEPRPLPHLAVMTPAGLACLDCPASSIPYGYWKRHGEPPQVTVTPSLNISHGEFHGWLIDGKLIW